MRSVNKDFDLTITEQELAALAPQLLSALREFVDYGLCRHANNAERKSMAEKFDRLATDTLKTFPGLKLNHCGAKTIVKKGG